MFPFAPWPAAGVPVRASVLAPVVEELRVLALERHDLALDERVERVELALDVGGDGEVHGRPPGSGLTTSGPATACRRGAWASGIDGLPGSSRRGPARTWAGLASVGPRRHT